jgi:hypothetical protein
MSWRSSHFARSSEIYEEPLSDSSLGRLHYRLEAVHHDEGRGSCRRAANGRRCGARPTTSSLARRYLRAQGWERGSVANRGGAGDTHDEPAQRRKLEGRRPPPRTSRRQQDCGDDRETDNHNRGYEIRTRTLKAPNAGRDNRGDGQETPSNDQRGKASHTWGLR